MHVLQTATFSKQIKKLHPNQKKDLDRALTEIITHPLIGAMKKGDLDGIHVYKFSMVKQLTLIAYQWCEDSNRLILLSLGSHENFYRDLKK
ncbi:MAG: type II toxin-antitoxin system RelE/ParE family toxin [Candidatus Babeliaceae bacterium]|nr:type II toxin-antitoxin system RelE/ParE family toxin [Candidatus Babeliaceae bacterium]